MTSAFSWHNSVSLCPTSFCTTRPNLPVTPDISWLLTFAFQSPMMKKTYFGGVLILEGLHRVVPLLLLQQFWSVYRLGLPWYWMACLGNKQRSCCHFRDCTQVLHFGYTAVCLRKLKHGLCINLEGCDGEGDGSDTQEGGSYITYGWLMLRFDRKLQISVKRLLFN